MSLEGLLMLITFSIIPVTGIILAVILTKIADKNFKAEMSKKH